MRKKNKTDWDHYFIKMAKMAATRSSCLRRDVGAVIVRDRIILSTGYNGAPKGLQHCNEIGCLREELNIPSGERQELCRAVHAEQNAIIQAAVCGTAIKGATLYCTHFPCMTCAKMIVNSQLTRVVYNGEYGSSHGEGDDMLKWVTANQIFIESGIETQKIK